MDKIKKYLKILLGCFLIAFTLNVFFKDTGLIPSGIMGFTILYNKHTEMSLWLIILLENIFFFTLGYLFINYKSMRGFILPFIAVPVFTFLTSNINTIIDISEVDKLLVCIYGGVLMGTGYRLIYKERHYATGSDMITQITKLITINYKNIANYLLDVLWVIISILSYGIESAMYTIIAISIMEVLSRRAKLGVSDAKVFYIITKKDKEVRDYIINELGYELTIFDVKGGFLKTKNKVLMSAIPTQDYYKLREGVKFIDPNAFISITDSYEVVNSNKSLKQTKPKTLS